MGDTIRLRQKMMYDDEDAVYHLMGRERMTVT